MNVAVILAAGAGSRFSGDSHKLNSLIGGRRVVDHAVDAVLAAAPAGRTMSARARAASAAAGDMLVPVFSVFFASSLVNRTAMSHGWPAAGCCCRTWRSTDPAAAAAGRLQSGGETWQLASNPT